MKNLVGKIISNLKARRLANYDNLCKNKKCTHFNTNFIKNFFQTFSESKLCSSTAQNIYTFLLKLLGLHKSCNLQIKLNPSKSI